jgi:primosomal protein N'
VAVNDPPLSKTWAAAEMSALVLGTDVVQVWTDGLSDLTALYVLRGITAADTIDLSSDFRSIKRAVLLGVTVAGAVAATNTTTTVTIPTGPSVDAAYLLVYGVHK